MSDQAMGEVQPSALRVPNNLGRRSGAVAFVGRENALETLRQRLQHTEQLAITALKGMGGIGKTELALQYALDCLQQGTYPGGIAWFGVRGLDVGAQIVEFAQVRLGLSVPDAIETSEGKAAYCWQHWPIPDGAGSDQVLVVFDDVTDYEAIRPYLPPPEPRFRVLMTTREYLGASLQTLELDVLGEDAALAMLRSLTSPERIDNHLESAKVLCDWVGRLPLALELVGRYLARRPRLTLEDLRERLESKRLQARALIDTAADMTARLGVAAAFELSVAELSEETQRLAYLLSLFAPAPIPWALVELSWSDADSEDLEDWRVVGLEGTSLLQPQNDEVYQVHPLIREFLQTRFGEAPWADETRQGYCKAMVQVAQQIPQSPTQEQILGVAVAVPHLAEAAIVWQTWLEDDDLLWPFVGLARFYDGQGIYEQARPWYEYCLEASYERMGEEHPAVATSLNNLAGLYESQGRYSDAEPLYQQALGLRQRLLGEEHPAVATSLNNLAGLYESQGRYSDAEPLYQQAMAIDIKALGENHPDTAIDYGNLAGLYTQLGRYAEAEPLYLQAIQVFHSRLGPEHPYTETTFSNFANLLVQTLQAGQADQLSDHPLTQALLQQIQSS